MRIIEAGGERDLAMVRELFEEYWQSFGFTPCFQGFADELAALPGKYSVIALLMDGDQAAGCVALHPLDERRVEFKRLYVRPAFRTKGTGLALLQWVVNRARSLGYQELVADTMPQMTKALAMYDRYGFERTDPYDANPTPGAVYLRLKL